MNPVGLPQAESVNVWPSKWMIMMITRGGAEMNGVSN